MSRSAVVDDGNTFRIDGLDLGDSIIGGAGSDTLSASGTDGSDHLIITGQQGTLVANGVSKVVFQNIDQMGFSGGAGDDIVDASASTMVGFAAIGLDGGTGNDVLIGCPSSNSFSLSDLNIGDHVYGGVSFDWLTVFTNSDSDEALTIIGQQGTLYANGSSDVVFDGIEVFQWNINPNYSGDHRVDASASML